MEIRNKKNIILCVSLTILMVNSTLGQTIKLDIIGVNLACEINEKDTLYYPYDIWYEMSVINDYLYQDFYKEHLIFGVSHYPEREAKNGIFRININGQICDLTNRGLLLQLVLYGDTLSVMSELHNEIFLSMTFRKEELGAFIESMKNIKITYHPIVEDYSCSVLGTYLIREDYDVIIDNPDIIISNRHILRE
jgi:hypothetical protein